MGGGYNSSMSSEDPNTTEGKQGLPPGDGPTLRLKSDKPFYVGFILLSAFYVLMIVAMMGADVWYAWRSWWPGGPIPSNWKFGGPLYEALEVREIRYALKLSLISCCITTILALWVAVPLGYLLSRVNFFGKTFVDAILDIPIFLPPLVIGLSLLILMRQTFLRGVDDFFPIALHRPAVVIAQFSVASAFAVRTMRATFDEISPRFEQVALTLGCSRSQAFWSVVFPEARRGVLTAGTLAWARSLGEFGPILVFAGSTRMRTEVLPVSVHLELSSGNLKGAVYVSLLMVVIALAVLGTVRLLGGRAPSYRGGRV